MLHFPVYRFFFPSSYQQFSKQSIHIIQTHQHQQSIHSINHQHQTNQHHVFHQLNLLPHLFFHQQTLPLHLLQRRPRPRPQLLLRPQIRHFYHHHLLNRHPHPNHLPPRLRQRRPRRRPLRLRLRSRDLRGHQDNAHRR